VIDQGNPFDVIFLDFAKAFDKVPKERLLEKLRAHGVRGELLEWV
jgi:predicted O-methyltransferase YrrM